MVFGETVVELQKIKQAKAVNFGTGISPFHAIFNTALN